MVEDRADWRSSTLARRAGGLHRIGDQSVLDVAGGGIHFETGVDGLRPGSVITHQLDEAIGLARIHAAIDKTLFHSAELGKLRQDRFPPQGGYHIGDMPERG